MNYEIFSIVNSYKNVSTNNAEFVLIGIEFALIYL